MIRCNQRCGASLKSLCHPLTDLVAPLVLRSTAILQRGKRSVCYSGEAQRDTGWGLREVGTELSLFSKGTIPYSPGPPIVNSLPGVPRLA